VSPSGTLSFDVLNSALKAAGEETRLRVLALLAEAELTVSDLTDILRQSQPRISRHLKLLAEAGLVERFREGTWAFFRLAEHGEGADVARTLIDRLNPGDQMIARDRARLASVRQARATAAQAYFRAHAAEWDRIRKLHVTDAAVEEAIRAALADKPFRSLLDLGTGTGRMLELFGPEIERGLGLDLSLDMLLLARDRLERAGLKNCSVRQGDIYDLPLTNDSFDVVILHQVLHFLASLATALGHRSRLPYAAGRCFEREVGPADEPACGECVARAGRVDDLNRQGLSLDPVERCARGAALEDPRRAFDWAADDFVLVRIREHEGDDVRHARHDSHTAFGGCSGTVGA